MAKKRTSSSNSNYIVGSQNDPNGYARVVPASQARALTDVRSDGSRVAGRGGRYTSHQQTYRDLRRAMGLSAG